jgi:hypothetical protein
MFNSAVPSFSSTEKHNHKSHNSADVDSRISVAVDSDGRSETLPLGLAQCSVQICRIGISLRQEGSKDLVGLLLICPQQEPGL